MGLMVAAVLAAACFQDPPGQDRGTEFIVNRLKERLKLTDDQTAKVKEIFARDQQERDKLEETRAARITELLNDEQKKLYEEVRRETRRPAELRLGGGGRGGRFGSPDIEELKRELTLTDDQAAKIKPLLDEFGEAMQKRMEGLRDGGFQGLNIQEEVRKFQEQMTQVGEKVKAHLNEDQKSKYDQLVERRTGFLRMIPLLGGLQQPGGPGPGRGPRGSVEDRVRAIMEALKVEKEDERNAIAGLVARVIAAQDALDDHLRASRERLTELSRNRDLSDQALQQRLEELREERRKKEKELAGLQRELAEVVSYRQEIELLLRGVLR